MKVSREVRVEMARQICDRCGEGEMVFTGMIFMTDPSENEHKCKRCGFVTTFDVSYPLIEYVEFGERFSQKSVRYERRCLDCRYLYMSCYCNNEDAKEWSPVFGWKQPEDVRSPIEINRYGDCLWFERKEQV